MAKVKVDINEYASVQPPWVRTWLAEANDLMIKCGCRVESFVVSNSKRTEGKFVYTSRKTKKTVCIIFINASGCNISLRGNHFIHHNGTGNILDELPEDMFAVVSGRKSCGCRHSDHSVNTANNCVHGIAGLYTYKGSTYITCLYDGFVFALKESTNFDMLTKWIALEAAFDGEIKRLQGPRQGKPRKSSSTKQPVQ